MRVASSVVLLAALSVTVAADPGAALAQSRPAKAQTPKVAVPKPPFTERPAPLQKYSPQDVLGVMTGDLAAPVGRSAIIVEGLKATDKTICVAIERSNGGYTASLAIPNPQKGPVVELALPSALIPKLGAAAGELAISAQATVGNKCSQTDPSLVASWRQGPSNAVSILINSQQATYVALQVAGGASQPCKRLSEVLHNERLGQSSFDTVCTVQLHNACGGPQAVSIQMRDRATYRPALRLTIRGRCDG